jgi:MSHA biogenesis protein MshL
MSSGSALAKSWPAAAQRKSSEAAEQSLLMPLTVEMPRQENSEARFDLSVVNAPAAQVFMAIVSGTRYNMLVGPEVAGNITVNLKDVTVKEALESIRELYGYDFHPGNRIAISRTLQTRVFQVNYLATAGRYHLAVTSSAIAGSGYATRVTPGPAGTGGRFEAAVPRPAGQTGSDTDFGDCQTRLIPS